MICPKCKAKIGMVPHQIATELGREPGAICYMCGYWLQNYPNVNLSVIHQPNDLPVA
jgi:hypothetical protein